MDKRNGLLNIITSVLFKVVLLVGSILTRRYLIQYIGNDVNGLNSLYISIIGFLSVAELGVGEAITFSMYKPIVNRDERTVAALFQLFCKLYLVIGGIIFFAGCAIMPFLPNLAKDYSQLDTNLYLTFGLTLSSVVITYAFSAKISLINAYKYNYIATTITSIGRIIEDVLKIIIVTKTKSYELFLLCSLVGACFQWILANFVVNRKFNNITCIPKTSIDEENKKQIIGNIKAMFMHKIGSILVNTADSVIISSFIGVIALGLYSNYTTIIVSLTGILSLFFTPLISIVGHAFVRETKDEIYRQFRLFYSFNYVLGVISCFAYYAIIDYLIELFFGPDLALNRTVTYVITLNYFIQFMRTTFFMFRSSTGTFYNDRYKPILEGVTNIVLSIIFVKWIGIEGVIIATIITNLFICDIVEPYVVFKYAFGRSVKSFCIKNYLLIALFALCLYISQSLFGQYDTIFAGIMVNGTISVALSAVPVSIVLISNPDVLCIFRSIHKRIQRAIRH